MLNNSPQSTQEREYQQIIALMEQFNCDYEQAKQHHQLMNQLNPLNLIQHLQKAIKEHNLSNQTRQSQLNQQEELQSNTETVEMTQKQLSILKEYLNGTLNRQKKKKNKLTSYEKFISKMKQAKKKLKCLKYLKPVNFCKLLKRKKNKNKYKKIDDHSILTQDAKQLDHEQSLDWSLIMDDYLMDELQEFKLRLEEYLQPRKELMNQIKLISNDGIKVQIKEIIRQRQICPFLLVKQNVSEKLQYKLKLKAESQFKILCFSQQKFKLLHHKINEYSQKVSCSVASFNIFGELQILTLFNTLTQADLDDSLTIYTSFIIKNKMFQEILSGKNTFKFINSPLMAQQQDYQQEFEQTEDREQMQSHKDLIVEQNMLYQSMLHDYAKKKEQEEWKQHDFSRKILKLKEIIRQEPQRSTTTYTLVFRLPNGDIKQRTFDKTDTLDYLRTWIMAQDEIQFESDKEKEFNLYYDYPPKIISQNNQQPLSNIFQQEQAKIKIIIQEL